ncbi:pyridoxamine 5'-phosphate oxidase family protein [Kineococcus sp. TBRC 1896]|uniref:Pyridoxamine 5'-phosphate oxidase family protein n=1 Tax=Kineococcus mangrovi TaxID=1660183 RepID=A0ABV4I2F2_9ACTN
MHCSSALPPRDCRRLLGSSGNGRAVFTEAALPAVLPTEYVVWGDRVWFPVPVGSSLRHHVDGAVLAYHVDHVEPSERSGWSVTVVGPCRTVPRPHSPTAACRLVEGTDHRLLALDMAHFTGRELGRAELPGPARAPGDPLDALRPA